MGPTPSKESKVQAWPRASSIVSVGFELAQFKLAKNWIELGLTHSIRFDPMNKLFLNIKINLFMKDTIFSMFQNFNAGEIFQISLSHATYISPYFFCWCYY